MAKAETWERLKHFKPDSKIDNWGNPDAIQDELLLVLDSFRDRAGSPVVVTSGTGGVHVENSYHYEKNGACAVDVMLPGFSKNPVNLLLLALSMPFNAIGFYPGWKYQGKVIGGLHLDMRKLKDSVPKTVTWMGVKKDGKTLYLPLTWRNLTLYGGKNG